MNGARRWDGDLAALAVFMGLVAFWFLPWWLSG